MEITDERNILELLEERKRKLSAEGLFDKSHKKQIPQNPKTIGVITELAGSALQDILQITLQIYGHLHRLLLRRLLCHRVWTLEILFK